jgi:hypothetical protein
MFTFGNCAVLVICNTCNCARMKAQVGGKIKVFVNKVLGWEEAT